jgi:hypothetical protein
MSERRFSRAAPTLAGVLLVLGVASLATSADARPPGPTVICDSWPEAAPCVGGLPDCTACHTTPPARNPFGEAIEARLLPDAPRPLTDAAFAEALPPILQTLASEDTDGDGFDNESELLAGTSPGDPTAQPRDTGACDGASTNPVWNVCGWDAAYVLKRVMLDVCGRSPSYDDMQSIRAQDADGQRETVHATLDACLDTAFWQGRNGALWRLAHAKIRPLAAVKDGANRGPVPLADYDDDYALFTWTQTDDRDAREVLTADYYVTMTGNPPRYAKVEDKRSQFTQRSRRAGMLTTGWFFVINTMFTVVPRTTAAQAYRAYLGLDIARSEGLVAPPDAELVDYDDKGITTPECASCHATLDPMSYPFSRYHGIAGQYTGSYDPTRPSRYPPSEGRRIGQLPERGYLLGEPVRDLVQWAEVAANSDAFAQATVRDYWRLLVGHDPTPTERAEFDALWTAFMTDHEYRVERMLHALVETEAYGVP